jgi:hypothetical protein
MMKKHQVMDSSGLLVICGLIVCCILVAGLWPFHQPQNQVIWSPVRDGLTFGHHSIVISSSPLKTERSQADEGCTIEIWLELTPIQNDKTILTFYTRENPRQFSLSVWERGLVLRREVGHRGNEIEVRKAFIADAFRDGKATFITLTSDGRKSTAYRDGIAVTLNQDFAFSAKDLTGQLVIGPSPTASNGWHGGLLGLVVYRRHLTATDAFRDYEAWTKGKLRELPQDESSVAAYRFDEHRGTIAHSLTSQGPNLYIPRRFVLMDQPMLQSPWTEFRWTRSYWLNAVINVAGFVPLGFFFCAYLSARGRPAPMITSVMVGAATSFTIELLQAYLPTRDSGITDLFTNTLGTYVGAALCRLPDGLTGISALYSPELQTTPKRESP